MGSNPLYTNTTIKSMSLFWVYGDTAHKPQAVLRFFKNQRTKWRKHRLLQSFRHEAGAADTGLFLRDTEQASSTDKPRRSWRHWGIFSLKIKWGAGRGSFPHRAHCKGAQRGHPRACPPGLRGPERWPETVIPKQNILKWNLFTRCPSAERIPGLQLVLHSCQNAVSNGASMDQGLEVPQGRQEF